LAEQAKAALARTTNPRARGPLSSPAITVQLADLDPTRTIVDQEQKLTDTPSDSSRGRSLPHQEETIKATYTAAEASAHISDPSAGSRRRWVTPGRDAARAGQGRRNAGRSGALDELLASGALTDLTSTNDDIQAQLDKAKARRTSTRRSRR